MNISSRHSNSNFTHCPLYSCSLINLLGVNWKFTLVFVLKRNHQQWIDNFCKIGKAKRVSNIWVWISATNIYSNSKFVVICKNVDFECWFIRTHTNLKPSTLASSQLDCHFESSGSYYIWCNHQMHFIMVHF